jgi:nicotinamide-nucleotide amidase
LLAGEIVCVNSGVEPVNMTAEILTVGDEILIGQITNTNSVWIAQQLNLTGIRVMRMLTVRDDENEIMNALQNSLRSDFVFITGGLGPTKDDITKKVYADFFGVRLVTHQETLKKLENYFSQRGREIGELNRQLANLPQNCTVIENNHGTAPGMWMKKDATIFISMPGVPHEMKGMMSDSIIPKIKKEFKLPNIYHKTILTQGIAESNLAELIADWENSLDEKNIKLAYLPEPGIVKLRLSSYGEDLELIRKKVENAITAVKEIIQSYIYGFEEYGGEKASPAIIISELLRSSKKTVSLAESCTGGYISSLLAAVPGASEIFAGAIIPYSNKAKHNLLQVEEKLFTTVGSVSKECVVQLASNVRNKFASDYAISVSGIAGPAGGTSEKPVGTVWIAVADKDKVIPLKFRFGDNRERNIIMTANAALNMLRKLILKENIQ